MTTEEAQKYMANEIKVLIDNKNAYSCAEDPGYIRGQAIGMIKAFKAAGILTRQDGTEILHELLMMI